MSVASGPARQLGPRRPAAPPARRELRVVPAPGLPRLPFVLATALLVVGGVLGLVPLNVRVNQRAFEVARWQRANQEAEVRYSMLQSEVGRLRSPARIAQVARARGMVPAQRVRVGRWPGTRAGATGSLGAATSPAAPGGQTGGQAESWFAPQGRSLKEYLAEP